MNTEQYLRVYLARTKRLRQAICSREGRPLRPLTVYHRAVLDAVGMSHATAVHCAAMGEYPHVP